MSSDIYIQYIETSIQHYFIQHLIQRTYKTVCKHKTEVPLYTCIQVGRCKHRSYNYLLITGHPSTMYSRGKSKQVHNNKQPVKHFHHSTLINLIFNQ